MMQHVIPFLFPYRVHLEAEIEYLKAQLAQKQRRVDELQDALIELKKPSLKIQYERKPDGKLVPTQPQGWDAYRAYRRANPETNGQEPKEENIDAIQGE